MERKIRRPSDSGIELQNQLLHWLCLLLFRSCLGPLPGTTAACIGVAQCDCEVPPGQSRPLINCRNKILDAVPTFQSTDLVFTELTLAGNNIRSIPDLAFRGLRFARLDLTGNRLINVSRRAFEGLEAELEELLIQLDPTSEFPTESMQGLVRLRLLRVIGYGQTSLPTDALVTLASLEQLGLTSGQLTVLRPQDLAAQRNSLRVLNLDENQLVEVPTDALSGLPNLTSLSLARNQLARVRSNAFVGCQSVESIDLSGNGLAKNLDASAFTGLEGSLRDVVLVSCQLKNRSLEALRSLSALRRLDLQNNDLANLPYEIFDTMTSLRRLSLDSNRLTAIYEDSFRGLTDALRTLHLGHNPILFLASGALAPLTGIEELYLDGLTALRLDRDVLSGHRNTLTTLSLSQTPLGDSVWPVITGLSVLKVLDLSSIGVTSIPDGAFRSSTGLQSIDLSFNNITSIGRGTFSGLQNSLNNIRLNSNQITTLDLCSFYGFRSLNYTRLGLAGNQLVCDCRLKWLYLAAKAESSLRFASLNWRCNSGVLMTQLNENDLVCNSSDTAPTEGPCPEILGEQTDVTTSATIATVAWTLAVRATKVKSTEISVSWSLAEFAVVDLIRGFVLTLDPLGREVNGTRTTMTISGERRDRVIVDLLPATPYEICVELKLDEASPVFGQTTCIRATTLPLSEDGPGWGVIVGALLGAIAVLAITLLVGYFVVRRHLLDRCFKDAESETGRKAGGMPRLGQNTKSFSRNCDCTSAVFPDQKPESKPRHPAVLDPRRLSEEDRARVLSMLQASLRDNVTRMTREPSTSGDGRAFDNAAFTHDEQEPDEVFATHVYDVIPEDNLDDSRGISSSGIFI